jgi:hypothetical protein
MSSEQTLRSMPGDEGQATAFPKVTGILKSEKFSDLREELVHSHVIQRVTVGPPELTLQPRQPGRIGARVNDKLGNCPGWSYGCTFMTWDVFVTLATGTVSKLS